MPSRSDWVVSARTSVVSVGCLFRRLHGCLSALERLAEVAPHVMGVGADVLEPCSQRSIVADLGESLGAELDIREPVAEQPQGTGPERSRPCAFDHLAGELLRAPFGCAFRVGVGGVERAPGPGLLVVGRCEPPSELEQLGGGRRSTPSTSAPSRILEEVSRLCVGRLGCEREVPGARLRIRQSEADSPVDACPDFGIGLR